LSERGKYFLFVKILSCQTSSTYIVNIPTIRKAADAPNIPKKYPLIYTIPQPKTGKRTKDIKILYQQFGGLSTGIFNYSENANL